MNNEWMPRYLTAYKDKEGHIEVYNPEDVTRVFGDIEYVRKDMLFEALLDKGYHIQITVTKEESQDGQPLHEEKE